MGDSQQALNSELMTRVVHGLGGESVNFISKGFPKYRIEADGVISDDAEEFSAVPSLKEIVAEETARLLEQQKRLRVRDLADKFEKGLAAANNFSNQANWGELGSLDRHVILKRLRDVLETLRGRVAGRNKDDAEEAISLVEALAVQLTQREGELIHEKTEVKKLATFLKQASEDAKKVIEEERALACAEIESSRAAILRIQEAVQEKEQISRNTANQRDLEDLMKEVQDARRIKMLHQPSKVLDMEHELQGLRVQLAEKSLYCIQLKKEVAMSRRLESSISCFFQIEGLESLGSCLSIVPQMDNTPDISNCSIQWYRIQCKGSRKEPISGATNSFYAPEPFDVGQLLEAEVVIYDGRYTVRTAGPIDPAAGLGTYVEALLKKPETEFNVVVAKINGHDHPSRSIHVFHVGKMRIQLRKGKTTEAKGAYSASMLLCGFRGGGNAAAQTVFWRATEGLSFTLAFESARERNAAIMLARRYASDCNVVLAGPYDQTHVGNRVN